MRLTRKVIKNALKELQATRSHQVTLAGIICATRFKFFEGNHLFPVKCTVSPHCQEEDSFSHLLKCTGLSLPPDGEEDELATSLAVLAKKATVKNPGYPEPIKDVKMGEFEIEFPPPPLRSEGEISFDD